MEFESSEFKCPGEKEEKCISISVSKQQEYILRNSQKDESGSLLLG